MKRTLLTRIGIGLLVLFFFFGIFLLFSGEEEDPVRDPEETDVEIPDEENDVSEREREEVLREGQEEEWEEDEERDERETEEEVDREREEVRRDNGITYQRKDEETHVYEGEGSGEFGIRTPGESGFLLYAKGNSTEEHFIITGKQLLPTYYGGGDVTHLFVNTFKEYEGVLLDREGRTNTLEITAEGPWRVEIRPLSLAESLEASQEVFGEKDEVLSVEENVNTLTVAGNVGEEVPGYFEISAYNGRKEVLVETEVAYEDTVDLPEETSLLQILAQGRWEIEGK